MDLLSKHTVKPTYIDLPEIKKTEEEIEEEKHEEEKKERKPRKPALRELFYLPPSGSSGK